MERTCNGGRPRAYSCAPAAPCVANCRQESHCERRVQARTKSAVLQAHTGVVSGEVPRAGIALKTSQRHAARHSHSPWKTRACASIVPLGAIVGRLGTGPPGLVRGWAEVRDGLHASLGGAVATTPILLPPDPLPPPGDAASGGHRRIAATHYFSLAGRAGCRSQFRLRPLGVSFSVAADAQTTNASTATAAGAAAAADATSGDDKRQGRLGRSGG